MNHPEEPPKQEGPDPVDHSTSSEEFVPEEPILPDGFSPLGDSSQLTRARRRRAQRMLARPGADERAALLDGLARRAFPSFEFFLFALLGGAVLGAAYLMDSPALLLLGILLAPLLTPWVGLVLAALTGSWRFFLLTLGGMLVASLLVFATGALAGLVGRLWQPLLLSQADKHSHLWWPDLFLVALGAVLLTLSFVRSEQKLVLPSIMLAYGFFLPLSAAGVELGLGAANIWLDGVLVFLVHLALATLAGGIVFAVMRFKPVKASGYILPVLIGLLSLVGLVFLTGFDAVIRDSITATRHTEPTPTSLMLPSMTSAPDWTATPSRTPEPSVTSQSTATLEPTPSYAVIAAAFGGGALVRTGPGNGTVIVALGNGSIVQVLPEIQSVTGQAWVHIRTADHKDGWVLQDVLRAVTLTPTPTSTLAPIKLSTPTT